MFLTIALDKDDLVKKLCILFTMYITLCKYYLINEDILKLLRKVTK